jgi:hypothetical protein
VFDLEFVPRSLQEFSENWLHGKGPLPSRLVMFLFAGFVWTLWVTRNKMAIEKVFPKVPSNVCMLLMFVCCFISVIQVVLAQGRRQIENVPGEGYGGLLDAKF